MTTNNPDILSPRSALAPLPTGDLLTFGLPHELDSLLRWALKTGVESPLLLLLEATGCILHPKYIGTVLHYLRQPLPTKTLANWSQERPYIQDLLELSEAFTLAPALGLEYSPAPITRAISKQLTGKLQDLAVVALVGRTVHRSTEEAVTWIESLRVWCLIQFLDAVYLGRPINDHLLQATSKLRLGVDSDQDWLKFFLNLSGPVSTLSGLSWHLKIRCRGLLAQHKRSEWRPIEHQTLTDLLAYSEGKSPTSANSTTGIPPSLYLQWQSQSRGQQLELGVYLETATSVIPSDVQSEGIQAIGAVAFDTSDQEDVLEIVDLDESDTPAQQQRKATGVLLSSVEDHQFLSFSWNRPRPDELAALIRWIDVTWRDTQAPDRDLALMAWIAMQTATSLRTVQTLEISAETAPDWRLDPQRFVLHREPPRRYNGWRADQKTQSWVRPRLLVLELQLPEAAQIIAIELQNRTSSGVERLGDWFADNEISLESRFSRTCKSTKGLGRITSGMLPNVLPQQVFARSNDTTFALQLASHPRSGLPGSCAYASFGLQQVMQSLPLLPNGAPPIGNSTGVSGVNAAGSELDPIEYLLHQACQDAIERVNSLAGSPTNWIDHHNALTAYCVLSLLTATGARPVSSPFESLPQFDLHAGWLFLEDKVSNAQHQGRLVPLPSEVIALLTQRYLPLLQRLARIVSRTAPKLGMRIAQLQDADVECTLPLFFLLTPELEWVQVSEKTLNALELFRWPLPWNLMRHRMASGLRLLGLNPEIINGLTGHAEQGTSPYGYFSGRTFLADSTASRSALTVLYRRLNLDLPAVPTWPDEQAIPHYPAVVSTERAVAFGLRARRANRLHEHAAARQSAWHTIEDFVGQRPVDSFSAQEWEILARAMLLTEKGLPHPHGSLRYETFSDWLQQQWSDNDARPRLRRRYLPALQEPSPLNEHSIGAQSRTEHARSILQPLREVAPSRLSLREARVLAALSLVLDCRVADPALLQDVLAGRNTRLVRLDGQLHMEHSAVLERWPNAPVRRFWVLSHTARWILRSRSGSNRVDLNKPLPLPRLQPLFSALGLPRDTATAAQLVEQASKLITQANAMEFPGYVAGYFNGKIVTAALNHSDWLRVSKGIASDALPALEPTGAPFDAEDMARREQEVDDDETRDLALAQDLPHGNSSDNDDFVFNARALLSPSANASSNKRLSDAERQSAQATAQRFFKEVRRVFTRQSSKTSSPRRDLDAALRKLIEQSPDVSPSCRLLGEWARSLLWRKVGRNHLRLSSIGRYLNALSVCFESEAYDHDLTACDAEELTEFYARILEARRVIRPGSSIQTTDLNDLKPSQNAQDSSYRTWRLAAFLVMNFHETVGRELGLEEPDWNELITDELPLSISPGVLLEREYLHTLDLLIGDPAQASHDELAHGMVLLLCMRFGVRGQEAMGMMRDDWVTPQSGTADPVVILVRSNRLRPLKTPAARRQIPLLFKLEEKEQHLVDRFLRLWEGVSAGDRTVPLFADPVHPERLFNSKLVRARLNELIKQVTLNDRLSLHHARHSFANGAARLLLDQANEVWPHADAQANSAVHRTHARKLLLSTARDTSRSLWALGRLLGHAHPHTTVRNYLHLVPDLAAKRARQLHPVSEADGHGFRFEDMINLDAIKPSDSYLKASPLPWTPEKTQGTSIQSLLRFLQLVHLGRPVALAAAATALPECLASITSQGLQELDKLLATRPKINTHSGGTSRLLSHITPARFKFWIDRAAGQGHLRVGSEPDPAVITRWLSLVGPSRQLLLYKPEHFDQARRFISCWSLSNNDFFMVSSRNLHERVLVWANEFGFSLHPAHQSLGGFSAVQIDTALDGNPPVVHRHRCAMLARMDSDAIFSSSFEMLLIYFVTAVFFSGEPVVSHTD